MDKILELFFENPEKEYYVREISNIFKISPTTVSKYLKDFEKKGLLIMEKKFNHLIFKSNTEGILFKRYKVNNNMIKLFNSGVIDYLEKEYNYPEAIILFGSFSKGENIKISDIDILIITSVKKEINLEKFEEKLNHKIQIHNYSIKDLENMKLKNRELLNNFINGIVLRGYWELYK